MSTQRRYSLPDTPTDPSILHAVPRCENAFAVKRQAFPDGLAKIVKSGAFLTWERVGTGRKTPVLRLAVSFHVS
jgi:hypothetical protein